jgi:hypothetical protein
MVDAAAFSTDQNTPSVMFVTAESKVSLRESLEGSPVELMGWLFNRTADVRAAPMHDHTIFTNCRKNFTVPSWINATAMCAVTPAVIVRMLHAMAENELNAWSTPVMEFVCSGEEKLTRRIYEEAMESELTEGTRIQQEDSELVGLGISQTPLDPLKLIQAHHEYYYATIRRYSMMLVPVFGHDFASGMRLLEVLKRNISEQFRVLWRRNNAISKEYCTKLYWHTFSGIHEKLRLPDAAGKLLSDKYGPRRLYQAIQDKTLEYQLKAKGVWNLDILSELMSEVTIPSIQECFNLHIGCRSNSWSVQTVESMCSDLRSQVIRAAAANGRTEGLFAKAQQDSAVYSAFLSNEWASASQGSTALYLESIRSDAEEWEQHCFIRIKELSNIQQHSAGGELISTVGDGSAAGLTDTDDIAVLNDVDVNDDVLEEGIASSQVLQSRSSQRDTLIQATLNAQQALKAQADRLASQLPRGRMTSEFNVVQRQTIKKSIVSRFVTAIKSLQN